MRRVTRARTHAVKPGPLTDSGEQAQLQEKESVKAPAKHLSLKDHKHFKHGRDVPPEAQLQYLKPGIFAQAQVHHKFVFTLPKDVRGDETDLYAEIALQLNTNTIYAICSTESIAILPRWQISALTMRGWP